MAKHLELDVLRTFEAVVREGSFARAAERMCLTAPAISLQMKRLDAVLGGDVFYKDGRGKSLTDKGQRLLEHARRMLHLNDLALSEFTQTNFRGRVRLGVAQDFAEGALIMLLREIQDAHREVQIDLVVDLNRRIHAAFERGELDVAIATSDPLGEPLGESLLDTELIWIAARDFKLTPGAPLPLVLFPEPCIVRDIVLRALVEHGISWRPACVSTSLEGLLSATKAGLGITVRSPQQLTRDLVKVSPGLGLPMLPDVSVAMRINDNGPSSQALTRHIAELVRNVVLVEAARVVRPLDDVVGHDAVEAFSVPKCAVKDDMGQPIGRPDRERMGSRGGTAELA
ncbi:hypothetical protein BSL82_18460 (plasmid) [Tardibacter chloracetimidivorans]|uniref:HTH lysR-type domain-containing protein n=1 Tax=Tardibacter chloracetimidivorans TaxID=1921510 RepID=A0A1L4A0L2_9SPHN|nr:MULTISPECIES: LysR substrate-binding domain-containing protein [Pseudomonadota]API61421.1 hypothetical protein BSL82_18460 [Tardibacter chloracetimidivorans]UUC96459.1 LysR substrate-binding domain-containing protein [Comamonas sp. C11]